MFNKDQICNNADWTCNSFKDDCNKVDCKLFIRQDCGDGSYYVEDSVGDLEQIYRPDIISEADDADNEIDVHDPVVALHPSFPYSYAPGKGSGEVVLRSAG